MTIEITDEMVEAVGQEVYGDNWEPRHDHIGTWQAHNVHAALTAALPIIEKQVREQCERDLQECLPVELWNTATDENGWLSDGHENIDKTDTSDSVYYCGEGSIDLHHIASLAARIVGEETTNDN